MHLIGGIGDISLLTLRELLASSLAFLRDDHPNLDRQAVGVLYQGYGLLTPVLGGWAFVGERVRWCRGEELRDVEERSWYDIM